MQPTQNQNLHRIFEIKRGGGLIPEPHDYEYRYNFDTGIRPMRCKDKWLVPRIHTIRVYDATDQLFGDDDGETLGGEMGCEYTLCDVVKPRYGDSDYPNVSSGAVTWTPFSTQLNAVWINGDRKQWVASVSEAPEPQVVELQRTFYNEGLNIYIKNALWFTVFYMNSPVDLTTGMAPPSGGVVLNLTFSWEEMDVLAFAQLRNCRSGY